MEKQEKNIKLSSAAKLSWDAISSREFNTIETIITAMNYTRVEHKKETEEHEDER